MTGTTVVEFVGPPAVGKTTLSRAVVDKLESSGYAVAEPAYRVAARTRPKRIATKFALASRQTLLNPRQSLAVVRAIVTSDQRQRTDVPRLLLNFLTAQAHHRSIATDLSLLDQGVLQACWSVGFQSRQDWEESFDHLMMSPLPDVVVIVRADEDTLTERLQEERASRTRVAPTREDVQRSMDGIEQLERFLGERSEPPETIRVENGTEDSIDSVASTVVDGLGPHLDRN